jgi:hypothetical protein
VALRQLAEAGAENTRDGGKSGYHNISGTSCRSLPRRTIGKIHFCRRRRYLHKKAAPTARSAE